MLELCAAKCTQKVLCAVKTILLHTNEIVRGQENAKYGECK